MDMERPLRLPPPPPAFLTMEGEWGDASPGWAV